MRPFQWNLSDLGAVPKNGLRVFSTFACGGGSTMGYKLEGFDVVAANDIDPEMARHYQLNHNPKHYFLGPIGDLGTDKLPIPESLIGVDILDGSPPCSTFSMAGNRSADWDKEKHFREGQAKQVLSDLFFDFIDFADRLKPKVIIAENVKGMLIGNAKWYVKEIIKRLDDIGYKTQVFLINAADYGLPQKRERVFFVASQKKLKLPALILPPVQPHVSLRTALADLSVDQSAVQRATERITKSKAAGRLWDRTQPGKNLSDAFIAEFGKNSYFNWTKLSGDNPAGTFTATSAGNMLHWTERRFLILDEIRIINSFPMDYQFKSDNLGGYMMGMSVPPYMMAVVAGMVRDQWFAV